MAPLLVAGTLNLRRVLKGPGLCSWRKLERLIEHLAEACDLSCGGRGWTPYPSAVTLHMIFPVAGGHDRAHADAAGVLNLLPASPSVEKGRSLCKASRVHEQG